MAAQQELGKQGCEVTFACVGLSTEHVCMTGNPGLEKSSSLLPAF
jgi:hypothetical protein